MGISAYLIISVYLLVSLLLGVLGYRATSKTPEDYFIANRTIGSVVFFFTMIATLFSGFAIYGVSGIAYRSGFGAYEFTLLANCLAPVVFFFIGYRVWLIGKKHGHVSPTEFFRDRFQSKLLPLVLLGIWLLFSLPFLALQWTTAGYVLEGLSGNTVPFAGGVIFLTVVTMGYVFIGGMRSVAWTDTFQGIMMFTAFFVCAVVIINDMGGLVPSLERLYQEYPGHFSRPGTDGKITFGWALGILIIGTGAFTAPQLFARFYVPNSVRPFRNSSIIWIPSVMLLGIPVVLVGALGRLSVPDLEGRETDQIFSLLLSRHTSPWLQALFAGGVISAMMSTASSMLLVLSSFVSRDLYRRYLSPAASQSMQVNVGRASVVVIGTLSCWIALDSNATLLHLLENAFSAFAMVLPVTIAALYWKRANGWGALAGIVSGLIVLLGFGNYIPEEWAAGLSHVVPAFMVNCVFLIVISYLTSTREQIAVAEKYISDLSETYWSSFDAEKT